MQDGNIFNTQSMWFNTVYQTVRICLSIVTIE